jgi:hypothetical protein
LGFSQKIIDYTIKYCKFINVRNRYEELENKNYSKKKKKLLEEKPKHQTRLKPIIIKHKKALKPN